MVLLRCACLCFWRALGQSAQAEQDTHILCSKQESVIFRPTPSFSVDASDPFKGRSVWPQSLSVYYFNPRIAAP